MHDIMHDVMHDIVHNYIHYESARSIDRAHARLPAVHKPQIKPNSPLLQDGQGQPQSCHTLRQGLAWQKRPGMQALSITQCHTRLAHQIALKIRCAWRVQLFESSE